MLVDKGLFGVDDVAFFPPSEDGGGGGGAGGTISGGAAAAADGAGAVIVVIPSFASQNIQLTVWGGTGKGGRAAKASKPAKGAAFCLLLGRRCQGAASEKKAKRGRKIAKRFAVGVSTLPLSREASRIEPNLLSTSVFLKVNTQNALASFDYPTKQQTNHKIIVTSTAYEL